MRSVIALLAAAWFVIAAVLLGDGSSAIVGEPPNQEIVGDPGAMAVHFVARILFLGLALIALALVDWARVRDTWRGFW